MKVAIIGPGFPPTVGGVETHLGEISKALVADGVEVEAWVYGHDHRTLTTTIADGVVVRRFPVVSAGPFYLSRSLYGYVRRHAAEFDLVHVHSFHSAASAATLFVPDTTPIVLTPHFHGTGHTLAARILHVPYKLVADRIFARTESLICVSRAEHTSLLDTRPDLADRVSVVMNAVDAETIHAAAPFPDVPPTALVLGRLEAYKQVDTIIAAFSAQSAPGQLVIIGDGPDRERLERVRDRSARRQDIRLLGRLPRIEVDRWLRSARCVISMSRHEAFGIVALEAVAAGAQALVSDLPAHREVVDLVGGIGATVVSDAELPARMANALIKPPGPIRPVRSWSSAAAETREIYEDTLRNRRVHQRR